MQKLKKLSLALLLVAGCAKSGSSPDTKVANASAEDPNTVQPTNEPVGPAPLTAPGEPVAAEPIAGGNAKIAALVSRQAIPRMGTPADVINLVEFFLRPESSFVTGQVVYLGGVF